MRALWIVCFAGLIGCGSATRQDEIQPGLLAAFEPLPEAFVSESNPLTDEKIALGQLLYHDLRLSKGGDVSCATCHPLDQFGADGLAVSPGHEGQSGTRNSPTVFNSAGQLAQFWDGRADTVEEQVEGPVLNPAEMAMASTAEVETTLEQVPAYRDAFTQAFPGEMHPISFENVALAIGAFERTLVTPSRWDHFLAGEESALTAEEREGFRAFTAAGCMTCHRGMLVGGDMYQRLGIVRTWPNTGDLGRLEVTGHERDRMVFKVPLLRNVAETAPYFHDGSVPTLEEAILLMDQYQLDMNLASHQVASIAIWLGSLTGELSAAK